MKRLLIVAGEQALFFVFCSLAMVLYGIGNVVDWSVSRCRRF